MRTKLSYVIENANRGNWNKAISLAAKFPSLGKHKNAILEADMAIKHRDFCLQIKKNPDHLIKLGIAALKEKYYL